jgi:hypothetical protein
LRRADFCDRDRISYQDFVPLLDATSADDAPVLYAYAAAWAGWILVRSDDWDAIADLPKVEAAMVRVIALDEGHDSGQAHLYLGVIRTLLPSNLGGKPEEGRLHFERAIELSQGRNLVAKVEFARRYARLMFDRALHDRLLREVLEAEARVPGLVLSNTLAQEEARRLLETADDYF